MSKFCQNCGAQIDDNAMFCISCGYQVGNNIENQQQVQRTQTQQQVQYQQPIQQQEQLQYQQVQQVQGVNYNQGYYQQQNANPVPKKKSKKKPIIISVIAVVLVAVLAFGGFTLYGKFFDDNVVNSGKFVFEEDGKTIYFGYQPMVLDGDSISEIDILDKSGEKANTPTLYDPLRSTSDGDTIYYLALEKPYLKKLTYKDGKMYTDTWVESNLLNSNENVRLNTGDDYYPNIYNLKYANGYIYFNTQYNQSILNDSLIKAFRIGRISKDGKSIEMLSDQIHAFDYTISDGWIYYFDNGYSYSSNDKVTSSDFDKDRVGIYRAKLDGSNIEKLYGDLDPQSDNVYEHNYNIMCQYMQVVNDCIYFIDHSKNGQSKVCRINKDGSDYQVVSENSASYYTIEDNNLYYILGDNSSTGEYNVIGKIYEKQIDTDNEEKELMDGISKDDKIQYYDNCLYVSSLGFTFNNSGQRYNFDKGKKEIIRGVNEGGGLQAKDDGSYGVEEGVNSFEWVDDDTKTED